MRKAFFTPFTKVRKKVILTSLFLVLLLACDLKSGESFVGDKMTDAFQQGKRAALEIIERTKDSDINTLDKANYNNYVFNWLQLQRFNIPIELRPKDSIVIHALASFYESYRGWIYSVSGIILVQIILVFILLGNKYIKRTKTKLAKTETQRHFLIENGVEFISHHNRNGKFLFISGPLASLLGYEINEIIGHKLLNFIVTEDQEKVKRFWENLKSTWCPDQLQCRFVKRDKSFIWLEMSVGNRKKEEIGEKSITCIYRNIHESKTFESALIHNQQLFKQITENINEALWLLSSKGVLYVSKGYEKISGLSCESFYEDMSSWLKIVHPDDYERAKKSFERVFSEYVGFNEEFRVIRPDGQSRWIKVSHFEVPCDSDEEFRFAGIGEDITEQKEAETALDNSEKEKKLILDNISNGVLFFGSDLKLIWANQNSAQMFGLSMEMMVGQNCYDLWGKQSCCNECFYCKAFGERDIRYSKQIERTRQGRIYDVSVEPVYSDEEELTGVVQIFQDITQRKRAEEELLKSEIRYKEVFNNSPIGIYQANLEGTLKYVNHAIVSIFGYDSTFDMTECVNKLKNNILSLYNDPVDGFEILGNLKRQRGKWFKFIKTFKRKDNTIFEGEMFICIKEDPVSGDERIFSFVEDVSVRAKMELELYEQAERLKQVRQIARVGDWEYDPKASSFYLSDIIMDMFGFKPENNPVNYNEFLFVVHPDDRKAVDAGFKSVVDSGDEIDLLFRIKKDKGPIRQVHVRSEVICDTIERKEKYIGTMIDVTELRQAQRDIEMFKALVESSSLSSCLIRQDGSFYYVNDATCRLLDIPKDKLLNMTVFDIVSGLTEEEYDEHRQLLKKTGGLSLEKNLCGVDDKKVPVEILSNYMEFDSEEFDCSYFSDISERIRMEEEMHQSDKMQAIGQLAGGIAHDFNNQLMGIMGYASMLESEIENEELSGYARNICEITQRSADLTQELLAFSRRGKVLSEQIHMHDLINEVVNILDHCLDKRINIKLFLSAEQDVIKGDSTQLQNALLNLALNARDAMGNGGELVIDTSVDSLDKNDLRLLDQQIQPGEYFKLCITDSGTGIDRETMKHIFEPFFTTKEKGKGTGMGLAAVFGTVKSHGGVINVYSEIDEGTTFSIYLPLSSDLYSDEKVEVQNSTKESECHGRVMVIDDEKNIRNLLSKVLKKKGYDTTVFADSIGAVEYYKKHFRDIDVILLDIVMPYMNGEEAFEKIRDINPDAKVLIISGYSINHQVQEILDKGALGYMQKPVSLVELTDKISEAISNKAEISD